MCQFSFRQVLVPAYTSFQGLYAPSNVFSANYMVLICCTCHFQSSSPFYFAFLCLQVYPVSNFCPDTRGRKQSHIQAHLFSCAVGSEEHCKQISVVHVGTACSVWATLGLPLLLACVLSQFTLLRLQVALKWNCLKRAISCVHFPGLGHSVSCSWVLHKGTESIGPAFCALPRSKQLR